MDITDIAILMISSGNLVAVLRCVYLLGSMHEKHNSHERRLTFLESKLQ